MPIVLRPPTLDRPTLPAQLAALGRARRRAALTAGVCALVAVAGGGMALACGLDAGFHLPPLARAFALVGVLAAAGVIWLRGVAPAFRLTADPMAVALDLESRFTRLNDSLASAVAFLADRDRGDDRGVSRRLRAAAVRKAERLAERLDLHTVVPAARAWRWFWAAALVVAVAGPLAAWKPALAAAALVRLVDPFGHHPYPAKTRIDFLSPAFPIRLPKGEGLDIRFAVTGVIPDRATVAVRVAGGDEWQEDYPLAPDEGKPAAGAAVTARLDGGRLVNTFAVRVTANDADTGWLDVAVVPPPRLVPLDGRPSPQVSAIPPAYTGLSPVELPDGAAVVEVPVGTVVSLRAAADVPLARAVLTFVGDRTPVEQPAGLAAVGHLNPLAALGGRLLADVVAADIPLTVSGDGRTMTATFTPSLSGMYALRMSDDDGVQGSRLLELRLVPDPAPVVTLLRPAPGRDTLLVVPTAAVPVRVAAEDEVYAVRRTFLEYRVGRDGQLKTIPLADARRSTDPLAAAAGVAATTLRPPVVRAEAGMILPVAGFLRDDGTPARDGDVVVLRGAADDHDDVTVLKDPGRSGDIELRVATPEAVEAEVQKELAGLRPELIRLREQQREVNRQTAGLTPQPDGTLSPADRSVLQAAEAAQRQVRGKVADPRDGLRAKADLLRETARANGLPKSQTTDRLDAVADELGRLADRDLAAIDPKLGDARQLGAQPPKPGQEGAVPNLLAQAGRHQKAVEEGLTTLLDLLARWGDAAEIRGEARVLRDAARRGAEAADKLPEKVPPGKPAAGLPPDQQAELERAAGKADQLADQSNALLGRAARLAGEKDAQAGAARSAAEGKEKDAAAAGAEAAGQPAGSDARRAGERKAEALKAEAGDLRQTADRAAAEADALRKAVEAAGGQSLPDDLRRAADAARANRQTEAGDRQRSAADRLDRLAGALTEKPDDGVPELSKPKRDRAAADADALAAAQDELRKRAAEAARNPDPEQKADALKRLAPEQQKLADEARDLLQRLTRDRADDAARDARAARDKMEAARDDLERGADPTEAQHAATEKLDDARDKLDADQSPKQQELSDEKRRKLADAVRALRDRQAGRVAEANRLQDKIVAEKEWSREVAASYAELEDDERALAVEVRHLADRELAGLPVFARVVKDAAGAMEKAADRVKSRVAGAGEADPDAAFDPDLEKANGDRVRRPMELAVRRLDQLLDALKPDKPKPKADGAKPEGGPMPGGGPMPQQGGGNGDVVPPLAQLKALRALQADLNQRTVEFARDHPDPAKLTDEDREELRELEAAQKEITALFEEVAKLFKDQQPPAEELP